MKLADGQVVKFACIANWVTRWAAKTILAGETYPALPEVTDVTTILDVGANCGAASVFFARTYPDAVIHAFEPALEPYGFLVQNAERYPSIRPHNFGLFDCDTEVELFHGKESPGASSIIRSDFTTDETERITLREARGWLAAEGIDRVDALKIDTEGCEVQVLRNLAELLPTIKVVYLEFHSADDRRTLHELLDPTHRLVVDRALVDWTGELAYLRRGLDAG
ncbi:MAG: FkbM family methyltransferase [Acidimicrobiales bacterium]|jgi:FkbM family methyltransferase|nr:FkbM family methyltransferase [Acidimicrobiales bacterium]